MSEIITLFPELNPETATRYLMIELGKGVIFSWSSAKDLNDKAKKISLLPSIISPPTMKDIFTISPDAEKWAIKKITENDPSTLIFDSILDASGPKATRLLMTSKAPSINISQASARIQQLMFYAIKQSHIYLGDKYHQVKLARGLINNLNIEDFRFEDAVALICKKPVGDMNKSVRHYMEYAEANHCGYLEFANNAFSQQSRAWGVEYPPLGLHQVLRAAHSESKMVSISMEGNELDNKSPQFPPEDKNALMKIIIEQPKASIEADMFGITPELLNAEVFDFMFGQTNRQGTIK